MNITILIGDPLSMLHYSTIYATIYATLQYNICYSTVQSMLQSMLQVLHRLECSVGIYLRRRNSEITFHRGNDCYIAIRHTSGLQSEI